MSLKKVTTEITYKVPAWTYCNHAANAFGQPSKDMCRFCVKDGKAYRCALYNEVLNTQNGALVVKSRSCQRAVAGFKSVVSDVEEVDSTPPVDPKLVIKTAIQEYTKLRKKLMAQGYPEAIADKVAQEYLLGG